MSAYDYKKEFKMLYQPKQKPEIIDVPAMKFIMVKGQGNPNEEDGEYKRAIEALYALSYAIKMSYKGARDIVGFFQYVVPPLEGFWWQEHADGFDYNRKETMKWYAMIRQPEFVDEEIFAWACSEVAKKKPQVHLEGAFFKEVKEGLCVQMMHIGSYDDEPKNIEWMKQYAQEQGYVEDFSSMMDDEMPRLHHEIYLSDPRKGDVSKCKTVLRHPIRKM